MAESEHPAILRFPVQADRISELMGSNEQFASICRDYAQIVADIAREERRLGHSSAVLAELLQLRSDLERDIVDWLKEAEEDQAASEQEIPT